MFSKSCTYAIKAVTYIALQSLDNKRIKLGDVAEHTGSPQAFTAKILGTLTRHKIIDSLKGPQGGFEMDIRTMKETAVSRIVYAMDGDSLYQGCALALSECNPARPCPLHDDFMSIRQMTRQALEGTSVYDLAMKLKTGEAVLLN